MGLEISQKLQQFFHDNTGNSLICKAIWVEFIGGLDFCRDDDKKHFDPGISHLGFSVKASHHISYVTPDRHNAIKDIGQDVWSSSHRYCGKAGKIVRKLFTPLGMLQFCDKDVEQFTNLFKSFQDEANSKYTFKTIKGRKIKHYYHGDNYSDENGTNGSLWCSCLRDDQCQPFLDIFVRNHYKVSLLVMLNKDEKVLGRALIWKKIDVGGELRTIMDRIYTTKESDVESFKNYAKKKKWMCKEYQSHSSRTEFIYKDTREVWENLKIELTHDEFEKYPYFDTFAFMSDKVLTNDLNAKFRWKLNDTGGGRTNMFRHNDYDGTEIHNSETTYCRYNNGRGDGICHRDQAVHLDYENENAFPDLCIQDVDGQMILKKHARTLHNGGVVRNGNAEYSRTTGKWYLNREVHYSSFEQTYIPHELAIQLSNDSYVTEQYRDRAIEYYDIADEPRPETAPQIQTTDGVFGELARNGIVSPSNESLRSDMADYVRDSAVAINGMSNNWVTSGDPANGHRTLFRQNPDGSIEQISEASIRESGGSLSVTVNNSNGDLIGTINTESNDEVPGPYPVLSNDLSVSREPYQITGSESNESINNRVSEAMERHLERARERARIHVANDLQGEQVLDPVPVPIPVIEQVPDPNPSGATGRTVPNNSDILDFDMSDFIEDDDGQPF